MLASSTRSFVLFDRADRCPGSGAGASRLMVPGRPRHPNVLSLDAPWRPPRSKRDRPSTVVYQVRARPRPHRRSDGGRQDHPRALQHLSRPAPLPGHRAGHPGSRRDERRQGRQDHQEGRRKGPENAVNTRPCCVGGRERRRANMPPRSASPRASSSITRPLGSGSSPASATASRSTSISRTAPRS